MKAKYLTPKKTGMTILEAAAYCGVSYQTFRRLLETGKIPYSQFGPRTFRISKENLDRYLRGTEAAR